MADLNTEEIKKEIFEIQELEIKKVGLLEVLQKNCNHPRVVMTWYEGFGCNDDSYRGVCLDCWLSEYAFDAPLDNLCKKPSVWISSEDFGKYFKFAVVGGHIEKISEDVLKSFGNFEIDNEARQLSII